MTPLNFQQVKLFTGDSETLVLPWIESWPVLLIALLAIILAFVLAEFRIRRGIRRGIDRERRKMGKRELARQKAVEDIHNDMGYKLTKITLYSDILNKNIEHEERVKYLRKISETSRALLYNLRDFIWTLDPARDSFFEVVMRIKDYADEVFYNSDVDFMTRGFSQELKSCTLNMEERRQLLFIFKESLDQCGLLKSLKQLTLSASRNEKYMSLQISSDQPRAFENYDFGNNLFVNFRERARKINANLNPSTDASGCFVSLTKPIPTIGD